LGVHWDVIVLYPRDVKSFYLVGLEAKVPLGLVGLSVDVVDGGFVVSVKPVEWSYSRLSVVREFLTEENSVAVRTHVLTAFPAGLGHSLFFILRRLGFDRRWFKMVNADPTVVPLKASNDFEVLRNIAYLHGVRRLVIARLKGRLGLRRSTLTPTVHAILAKSNYNHNKHLIQQHVPKKIIEKLPKVTLT